VKSVVVELDDAAYAKLCGRAKRLGLEPGVAARQALERELATEADDAEERRERTLTALERLRARAAMLPPADAAALAREAREELEARDRERGWTS
jgi:hypothetical protein